MSTRGDGNPSHAWRRQTCGRKDFHGDESRCVKFGLGRWDFVCLQLRKAACSAFVGWKGMQRRSCAESESGKAEVEKREKPPMANV